MSTKTSRRLTMTARSIWKIRPEAGNVAWFDATTKGLALEVTPAGARTWWLFYRHARTARRVKIGTLSAALSLSKARDEARSIRARIESSGADPAAARAEARTVFTVDDLADLFLVQHAKAHKRSWRDDYWRLQRYVRPAWGTRPVREITRADVHALLDKIAAAGHPVQANRVQALISKMWNFAIDRSHTEVNPCHRLAKHGAERPREIVADDTALRTLWAALEAQPGDATAALRLRLLTGQRGNEIYQMQWADVDLARGVWTIPGGRTKNGRPTRVPLVGLALADLTARAEARVKDEPRVFPRLSHNTKEVRALAAIRAGAYTWHDLRRTVATRLADLGIREETISRILNHAKQGVTAQVYNQHAYDAEKREALTAWEAALARIVTPPPAQPADRPAHVVTFARGGRR